MTLGKTILFVCGLMILGAALINATGILLRVFFVLSYDLVTDLSVWVTVWGALIGGAPLLLEREGHVSIDFLPRRFGRAGTTIGALLGRLSFIVFGGLFAYGGYLMVESLYVREAIFPRFIEVPKWIVMSCVPLSMALIVAFGVVALLKPLRDRDSDE